MTRSIQAAPRDWTDPVNISVSDAQSSFPSIAADPTGGVHVIWTEDARYISYSRVGRNVTPSPVDIIVTPGGGLTTQAVLAADDMGYLHAVWRGNGVMYSRAAAAAAASPHGWSAPKSIVPSGNYPDIRLDRAGTIHVVYAEQSGPRSGIMYLYSIDGGIEWSDPVAVFTNASPERMVDKSRLAVGPNDALHVTWVETAYPQTFPPLGIRYSQSLDNGATWSEANPIADGPFDDPGIAARANGEVHIVWSGTSSQRFKFHQWSGNAGAGWNPTWHYSEYGGMQGWPALTTDGSDNLHWGFVASAADRADSTYYATWEDGWSEPALLLQGVPGVGQNQANVSAAVALGNELHMVLQNPLPESVAAYQQDIFYVSAILRAPPIAAHYPETPLPSKPTFTPSVAASLPTDGPKISKKLDDVGPLAGDWVVVALPLAASSILVGGAILMRRRRKVRRVVTGHRVA